MKKLLFALPIVALLAAGCNSSEQATSNQTPVQTQVAQNTNPKPTPTPSPTPTPIVTATPASNPTPTASQTSNWKTYDSSTSQYYKNIHPSFSFKYPSDWYIGYQGGGDAPGVNIQSVANPTMGFNISPAYPSISDPKSYCQNLMEKGEPGLTTIFSNEKTFQVDGYPAYSADVTVKENSQINSIIVCIGGGANIIVGGDPNVLNTFNEVVSTIQFGQ